ncbi:MFS transporter [Paenibacillus sp. NEAU-GSW1]|uniref:MFS transporter n=1 Tax=Paenibacillus sp. NEAU-GSW1 TaxID=2682486 RepID=UPI001C12AD96|nr:MFS transporter [Paenibacillus sp. NEAU-GSW1]
MSWITALCLMGDSMLYIVLPLHWKEAGLDSLVGVGFILSINRLVRLPLNPFVSWMYRYISLRQGLVLAVVLATFTTAGYGLANNFHLWVILRCLWGLAWSLLRLGAYYAILELQTDDNRGRLFGVYNGNYRLGSLFGMILGGSMADLYGLLPVSFLFTALSICISPFLLMNIHVYLPKDKALTQTLNVPLLRVASIFVLFRAKKIIGLLVTALGSAMMYEGIFTSTLSNFTQSRSTSFFFLGFSFSAAFLAGGLQALRWGWGPLLSPFIGKLSDQKFSTASLVIAVLSFAGILFFLFPLPVPTFIWIFVTIGILITSTCMSTLMDSIAASIATIYSGQERNIMTAYSITLDLGAAIGPIVAFWALQQAGYILIYWGASAVFIGLLINWCLLMQKSSLRKQVSKKFPPHL